MRPTDALLHRRITLDHSRRILSDVGQSVGPDGDPTGVGLWEIARNLVDITSDGEVYYVSADMTAVAKAAAKIMPRQELRRDDLPSERGFMVYDHPIGRWQFEDRDMPVVGFAWGGVGLGAFGRKYPDAECTCPPTPPCAGCDESARRFDSGIEQLRNGEGPPCTCPGCHCDASEPLGEGEEFVIYPLGYAPEVQSMLIPLYGDPDDGTWMFWIIGDVPVNDDHDLAMGLLATWTLMQQTLSVSERRPADRPERRRCARANLPSDVVVVRLRRRSVDDEASHDGEGVPWSHRWLVSGHWRNQWLPSRAAHRLQWIIGHVKGPAGKPLLVKDRVTAWVR